MKDDGTTRGDERFTGAELADHVGISRRAVRYYVAQGLLAPPVGFGRGAYYTAAHAADLALIRDGQAEGRSLDSIRARLGRRPGVAPPGPSPEPSFWMRVPIVDGAELHLRGDLAETLAPESLSTFVEWARRRIGTLPRSEPEDG